MVCELEVCDCPIDTIRSNAKRNMHVIRLKSILISLIFQDDECKLQALRN